jgi:WD40 repeat protein
VIGDYDGRIQIYNSSSLSLVISFQAHSDDINRIKQSPFKTNYVATCSDDKTVKILHVLSSFDWTLITTYSQHSSYVYALDWLDNDTLASAGYSDQTIKLWSATTGQTKRTIQTNQEVWTLKVLNTNIHLAAGLGYPKYDINIYNINNGNLVSSLKGHSYYVNDLVQLSSDLLASASSDETVRIWNLTTNTCKFILTGHTNWVRGLKQITPSILASGSVDDTIKLWDTTSGELIRTLTGHTSYIEWSVDLLNSQTLVSGSWDQTIKLWNWSTGECFSTIQTDLYIKSLAVINLKQLQQTTTKQISTSTRLTTTSKLFISDSFGRVQTMVFNVNFLKKN